MAYSITCKKLFVPEFSFYFSYTQTNFRHVFFCPSSILKYMRLNVSQENHLKDIS